MLGFNSGVVVLHDSEAVRYQLNSLVRIVRTDNYRTTAGITGSLTPAKPSRTRKCLLRIPSSPYNREPPVSEEGPATTSKCAQEAKNLRLTVLVRRRTELQRIVRERNRTTLFEFPTQQAQDDPLRVLAAGWISCAVKCPPDDDRYPACTLLLFFHATDHCTSCSVFSACTLASPFHHQLPLGRRRTSLYCTRLESITTSISRPR